MLLLIYLLLINIAAFITYGIDKKKAIDGKRRISEKALITYAALGGSFGALLGMLIWHHKTRKKKFYITVPVLSFILLLFIGFCLYSNYHIEVTKYEYEADFDMTIVQVSDLHNQLFGIDQSYLLSKIKEQDPDIIVVTGDAIDSTFTNYSFAKSFFEGAVKIAPVYYVTGNHEVWLKGERFDSFIKDLEKTGVNFIDGQKIALDNVEIIGTFEESTEGIPSFTENTDKLKILLAHDPGFFESYKDTGADIVFTGHIHGGQIIVPGKGGLLSPDMKFFPDLYEGQHEYGGMTMFISRGMGNSILPLRINNFPELVVVNIRSKA